MIGGYVMSSPLQIKYIADLDFPCILDWRQQDATFILSTVTNNPRTNMGVTGLWDILWNLSENKPLKYLSGKRVAVDLSGWVVQATQCKGLNTSKNPHLRNLFFRVSRLLQDGALPIFVMEGDIPSLKINSFKKRNEQHGFHNTDNDKIKRSSFNRLLLQCKDLLESLGVPCLRSSGEAEALCAFLCANGIVEGVITEDNDAFLYGADSIFRDFSIDPSNSHVKLYNLKSEKNKLHLDRTKLVAIALLLGCDYIKGVPGIGKNAVLQLFEELPKCDFLQRFKDWKEKEEAELFPGYQPNVKKSSHCSRCDHLGSQTKHRTNGCDMCDSKITCYLSNETKPCLCAWHKSNEIALKRKAELKVYNAAKKVPGFPNLEVVQEYLYFSDIIPEDDKLEWRCPNLLDFQEKAFNFWNWTMDNSLEKIFPIITSWHLYKISNKVNAVDESSLLLKPIKILKQKVVKGQDCLLVQWEHLTENSSLNNSEDMCSTEYEDRFSEAYPDITKIFLDLHKVNKSKPQMKSKEKSADSKENCKKVMSQPPVNSPVYKKTDILLPSVSDDSQNVFQCSFSELPLSERIKIISRVETKMNNKHYKNNVLNDFSTKILSNTENIDFINKENIVPESCKDGVQNLQNDVKDYFIPKLYLSSEIMKSNDYSDHSSFCCNNHCLLFNDSDDNSFEILTQETEYPLQQDNLPLTSSNSLLRIFDSFSNLTSSIPNLHQDVLETSQSILRNNLSNRCRTSLCLEFTCSDNSRTDILNYEKNLSKPIYICHSKSDITRNSSSLYEEKTSKKTNSSISTSSSFLSKPIQNFQISLENQHCARSLFQQFESYSPCLKSVDSEMHANISPVSSTPYKYISNSNLLQQTTEIYTPLIFDSSLDDSVLYLG